MPVHICKKGGRVISQQADLAAQCALQEEQCCCTGAAMQASVADSQLLKRFRIRGAQQVHEKLKHSGHPMAGLRRRALQPPRRPAGCQAWCKAS